MHTNPSADATVATALAALPLFKEWDPRPLDRSTRQSLQDVDHQTLTTIAAVALRRVAAERAGLEAPPTRQANHPSR